MHDWPPALLQGGQLPSEGESSLGTYTCTTDHLRSFKVASYQVKENQVSVRIHERLTTCAPSRWPATKWRRVKSRYVYMNDWPPALLQGGQLQSEGESSLGTYTWTTDYLRSFKVASYQVKENQVSVRIHDWPPALLQGGQLPSEGESSLGTYTWTTDYLRSFKVASYQVKENQVSVRIHERLTTCAPSRWPATKWRRIKSRYVYMNDWPPALLQGGQLPSEGESSLGTYTWTTDHLRSFKVASYQVKENQVSVRIHERLNTCTPSRWPATKWRRIKSRYVYMNDWPPALLQGGQLPSEGESSLGTYTWLTTCAPSRWPATKWRRIKSRYVYMNDYLRSFKVASYQVKENQVSVNSTSAPTSLLIHVAEIWQRNGNKW